MKPNENIKKKTWRALEDKPIKWIDGRMMETSYATPKYLNIIYKRSGTDYEGQIWTSSYKAPKSCVRMNKAGELYVVSKSDLEMENEIKA